jgi:phosphoribosylamine--glycine ligase
VAIKPLGLTGGKGVRLMGVHLNTLEDVNAEVARWIQQDGQVLLEERLVGEEFSRMVFACGRTVVPMPVAQDFKYAYDGDTGSMTGGMGAYTSAGGSMPFLTSQDLAEADAILQEVVVALEAETGQDYRGFLYGQFMATPQGVKVIEFNVRLGDPEAINEMALLAGDAPHLFQSVACGSLDADGVHFLPQASVCKYLVPAGYPDNDAAPAAFDFDPQLVEQAGLSLICASVARENGVWKTLGSRTLAIVGTGDEPGEISARIETLLARLEPPALRHRQDIGDARVLFGKASRMDRLRQGGRP